jgi:hypothetical protein
VDVVDDGFGEETPRQTGLIAHHHDGKAGPIQRADGGNRPRKERDAFGAIEVPDFFDERAVAVEEDRTLERLRHDICRAAASTSAAPTPRMHA